MNLDKLFYFLGFILLYKHSHVLYLWSLICYVVKHYMIFKKFNHEGIGFAQKTSIVSVSYNFYFLKEIQKAADSKDVGATLSAVTDLIQKTCLECHKLYLK